MGPVAATSLSSQVTNQSGLQRLLQDDRPVKLGHVECGRRGSGVAGSWAALTGNGGRGHVQWGRSHVQWGRTGLIILAVAILIQGQGKALSFLSSIAEPNTNNLPTTAC